MNRVNRNFARLALLGAVTLLGACAGDTSDLQRFVAAEKAKKPGPIAPLPQIKPYETFIYQAQEERSPFVPDSETRVEPGTAVASNNGLAPDANRNKEYLEQYTLDGLKMVGTIDFRGTDFALVEDPEGTVHRVTVGNYLGQNHGKITEISELEVRLTEIIPDGLGGWMERQAAIGLSE
ncbi:MAG: pilus assembly protein PilP [Gammaproteobacteria bacterium]|nr:pilus assembly protein PilP [Gammaproteobacteria bacterium]